MTLDHKLWSHFGGRQLLVDAAILAVLAGLVGLMLRFPGALGPMEGGGLVAAVGFLLIMGRRALGWHRAITVQAFLPEWAERIAEGDYRTVEPPPGLDGEQRRVAGVINDCLRELGRLQEARQSLVADHLREWDAAEGLLKNLEAERERSFEYQESLLQELDGFASELRAQLEDTQVMARVADRRRGLADAATSSLGSGVEASLDVLRLGLERQEELVQLIRDTLPRLRRESEGMGQLADRAMRRAARLGSTVKGVASHGSQMLESVQDRSVQLLRMRELALDLRELGEGLQRRARNLQHEENESGGSLEGIQDSLRGIDHVAKQTGLLAVNAAILSQESRGSRGFQVIGSKIRLLSEQTAQGTAEVARILGEHRLGLERDAMEVASLGEAIEQIHARLHELILNIGRMDHHGQELERSLETHQELIRDLETSGREAIESLQEIPPRAEALGNLSLRQRASEQELESGYHQALGHMERLSEGAGALIRSQEEAHRDLWMVVERQEALRLSKAFQALAHGRLHQLWDEARIRRSDERASWSAASNLRAQRGLILGGAPALPPGLPGRVEEDRVLLRLLEADAFGLPRPGALESLDSSDGGRTWRLTLMPELRHDEGRLALLVSLRDALHPAWIPDPDFVLGDEGVRMSLPFSYPNLPLLLSGLGLELSLSSGLPPEGLRTSTRRTHLCINFLWVRATVAAPMRLRVLQAVHGSIEHMPSHERFPLGPAPGFGGPCPRCTVDSELRVGEIPPGVGFRTWVLGDGQDALASWGHVLGLPLKGAEAEVVMGRVRLPYARPEALLLALMHPAAGFFDAASPSLVEIDRELKTEVLAQPGAASAAKAWELLRRLEREGWIMALPDHPDMSALLEL
ncbi:MAG TPA: methyl-accepting chemotaxis protein [Holophagaceae bacterium]|nr:methyl-accepting chemotaxis protein [Holophagaceae bacterium]